MEFLAVTQPGIGEIAAEEIGCFGNSSVEGIVSIRNGELLRFKTQSDPKSLLSLRTTEDVYVSLGSIQLKWEKDDPKRVGLFLLNSKELEPALSAHRSTRGKGGKKTTYRVVVQTEKDPHPYRRVDLQRGIEEAISERYHGKWKLVDEDADLEFWGMVSGKTLTLGLRLSDSTMRHRTYKIAHLPASLKPTVAAAMVRLSCPQAEDVFLDPMAGAGTILVERAEVSRYQMIYGGDIREEAVGTMASNIGKKYKPIAIQQWDATQLPLKDEEVDKIVCNLPFGKQIGTHKENVELYPRLINEFDRVLKKGGKIVLLTTETTLFEQGLKSKKNWHLVRVLRRVTVLGLEAEIFVIEKEGEQ